MFSLEQAVYRDKVARRLWPTRLVKWEFYNMTPRRRSSCVGVVNIWKL